MSDMMTLDYTWLKSGCINDTYLNWMIGLLTARDPNIEDMNLNGVYRKFVSCGFEGCRDGKDMTSHYKRFQFIAPTDWVYNQIDESQYKSKWPKDMIWITL
jgi:hypothetical protein